MEPRHPILPPHVRALPDGRLYHVSDELKRQDVDHPPHFFDPDCPRCIELGLESDEAWIRDYRENWSDVETAAADDD